MSVEIFDQFKTHDRQVTSEMLTFDSRRRYARLLIALLLLLLTIVCCLSLTYLAPYHIFHIFYDEERRQKAILAVAAFSSVSLLFVFADFSFGYFVGLYFYTMVLGYLWLSSFSDLIYNHPLAEVSAAASAVLFLLPALFISSRARPAFTMSERAFELLLMSILLLGTATVVIGAWYNFRIVALRDIYHFRNELSAPLLLNYITGMTTSVLLPFAFASFAMRNAWWRAAATLVLTLLFYPITLSKLSFFAPAWLVAMMLLSRSLESRVTAILSLLLPALIGVILIVYFPEHAYPYFHLVNLRMVAIPSVAMDIYNHFFAAHDLTYFCQISFTKSIFSCPYQEPLSIVMEKAYNLGNFNASLFATEGIASVGPWLAPFSVFICGLVIALGNRASAGLPPRFILISGAVLPIVLLNVPLTTALLTHGGGLLFLLWYITPRRSEDLIKTLEAG